MTSLFDRGERSRGEWRFRLLSIPVRVQPWFWLVIAVMCGREETGAALIWIAVCFVSILVHEMGHALVFRAFGVQSEAVLYGFGGLTIPRTQVRGTAAEVLVSLAGPVAGFALAGLTIAAASLAGAHTHLQLYFSVIPSLTAVSKNFGYMGHVLLNDLLYVNILWGLVNLLPIYPLDGGRVSRALFERRDPRHGRWRSLWLSAIAGAIVVLLGLLARSLYMVVMFGVLAASSAQMAEALRGSSARRPSRWPP